jgi:alpha-tubulin suppressor-like RCC1 family protein
VRLVDSLGNPRAGIPVRFIAFSNGSVEAPVVSTNANGVASPGRWTLGDIPGAQRLEARVSDATTVLQAAGTGTPVHYVRAGVAAGGFSSCARATTAAVDCWGEPPQIGTGGSSSVSTPTPVNAPLSARSVRGGATHFCALDLQNAIWCWGMNARVDTSGTVTTESVPTRLPSEIEWRAVSPGLAHNCAIASDADAYCWGNNIRGQLGDGSTQARSKPNLVAGGFSFSEIASGSAHTCALSTTGQAFCWGANDFGQLGDGTTTQRVLPTAVSGGHVFQSIGSGDTFTCGLRTDGRVYCWGVVTSGAQSTPITYDSSPSFVSLSVGTAHVCALAADAGAWCWGANDWGQLGDSSTVTRGEPTRVAGGFQYSAIAAGFQHSCALTAAESAVVCWGRNRSGELGDSTIGSRSTPRHIVLGVNP